MRPDTTARDALIMTRSDLRPLFDWYGHTALAHRMSESAALIATAQIVHLVGMTLLIGTVMMVDLTLLGFGIKRHPVARVGSELAPWTAGGLAILLVSGPLNLSSEALKCFDATFFWIKMGLLVVAIVFHFTWHRRVVMAEPPAGPGVARFVGFLSLALWFGVALAAKFIGFIGDDLRERAGAW